MIRLCLAVCAIVACLMGAARAQAPSFDYLCIWTGAVQCSAANGNIVSASNPLPVAGTFSASLAGFTPNGNFATLTATNSSASVGLPAGTTVQFQNTGTTAVSCTLGVGSATAAASEIVVQPSSTKSVAVGSNTFGACIDQTGSTSNLVVLAGGSGLGLDSGGGGSGGSGSSVTTTPATATPTVSASAGVTSLVLKASAATVQAFHAENATATGGYCILYNGTSAPGTGALTAGNVLAFQLLPASGYCDWTATSLAITASTGAVVLISSAATPFTYTTGTVTAAIYGAAQ